LRKRGVKIALYPTIAASSALQAAWQLLNDCRARGTPALEDWAQCVKATPWGAIDLKTLTRAGDVHAIEEQSLPADRQRDYASTFGHATQLGFGDSGRATRSEAALSRMRRIERQTLSWINVCTRRKRTCDPETDVRFVTRLGHSAAGAGTPFSPAFVRENMNSPSLQEGRGYLLGSSVLRRR
jgi:hypothetical protein